MGLQCQAMACIIKTHCGTTKRSRNPIVGKFAHAGQMGHPCFKRDLSGASDEELQTLVISSESTHRTVKSC